jgi:hypothetical protein
MDHFQTLAVPKCHSVDTRNLRAPTQKGTILSVEIRVCQKALIRDTI